MSSCATSSASSTCKPSSPATCQTATAPAEGGGAPFLFTDSAAGKVRELIEEEGNAELKLRIFVSGGGCSGFQYGFAFDEAVAEDDVAVEKLGVQVVVDAMSYQYLAGAEIDFEDGLEGSRFVIKNPNATSTCGCGSSFSV
ncbi:Iron-sulfur cluster insertion protein ErpA [Azoarcus sp. Aa7]|nr:Iron-sulfur cluster insertion protein ErpA [Azoarcus sp. Aa7]